MATAVCFRPRVLCLISTTGGTEPRWAHSGRELFYKSGNQFMVVE